MAEKVLIKEARCEKFKVKGLPATFATKLEKEWKENLYNQIPKPCLNGHENGLKLKFFIPSLERHGQPFDIDNLCEPVFSVLVNKIGWFNSSRINIQWWQASKQISKNIGCDFEIYDQNRIDFPKELPLFEDNFTGTLPDNARSKELVSWAHEKRSEKKISKLPTPIILYLLFNNIDLNLGDISTGKLKSFIDCLFPLFGGELGAPQDHRIVNLIVEKRYDKYQPKSVLIKLWSAGEFKSSVAKKINIADT
jgi:hypothetical protein